MWCKVRKYDNMFVMAHIFSVKPRKKIAPTRKKLFDTLNKVDQLSAKQLVDKAIFDRWDQSYVSVNIIGHCMSKIGARWHSGKLSIPVERRATQIALSFVARAQDSYGDDRRIGLRAIIAAVEGDKHVIGGLTFADMLRFDGWDVVFLGANSPVDSTVEMVRRESPDLVGLSVSIKEYLPTAKESVRAIKALPNPPVVVIGGAAVKDHSVSAADFSNSNSVDAITWLQTRFNLHPSSKTVEVMLTEVGDQIKALRKDKGLSQQQLATKANLDRSYISAVEHGKQKVSFITLKRISDALGIAVSDLITV